MNNFAIIKGSVFIAGLCCMLVSCTAGKSKNSNTADSGGSDKNITQEKSDVTASGKSSVVSVTYGFRDASVPPQYHRSYEITAREGVIRKVVDSYGDVISDTSRELSSEEWADIQGLHRKYGIRVCKEDKSNDGCRGGTGRYVVIEFSDETVIRGSVSLCGGEATGDLCGDYEELGGALSKYLPRTL
jgi:hypothetical protein